MPQDTGTVTEVGVGNIQFYIPNSISGDSACPFDPGDEFCVRTIRHVGLLLTPADLSLTVADLVDGLDLDRDVSHPDRLDVLTATLD